MIRVSISTSEKVASLSQKSLTLFCLLIPHFNSHGKMNGNPHFIKGQVCPLIKWLDLKSVEVCLKEISEKTSVKWFESGGQKYLHSIHWERHQKLERSKLGDDLLPSYQGLVGDKSATSRRLLDVQDKDQDQGEDQDQVKDSMSGKPDVVREVLDDLNALTGKAYKATTKAFRQMIQARIAEGHTLDDFKRAHRNMIAKWSNDPKMVRYLRPATLYQASKFDCYCNETITPVDTCEKSESEAHNEIIGRRFLENAAERKAKEITDGKA
jgi:uncharacterized phage protein (TIGR02220 family)